MLGRNPPNSDLLEGVLAEAALTPDLGQEAIDPPMSLLPDLGANQIEITMNVGFPLNITILEDLQNLHLNSVQDANATLILLLNVELNIQNKASNYQMMEIVTLINSLFKGEWVEIKEQPGPIRQSRGRGLGLIK